MKLSGCFWSRQCICLIVALSLILCQPFAAAVEAAPSEIVEHYKMLSTVQYSGKGQFQNQVETMLTVKKDMLSDGQVQYSISSQDFDLGLSGVGSEQELSGNELSFIVDKSSRTISGSGNDITMLEEINNLCVKSLKNVTKQNIGKTWKQTFSLSGFNYSLPKELKLTMTAMKAETKAFGKMIAARALSEPFVIKVIKANKGFQEIKSRIRAVYLFDSQLEDIYMSVSVFEASTNMNGFHEELRHEVATYKTDSMGTAVDLTGLSKKFESFVQKVGLNSKDFVVKKAVALPQWAQTEAVRAAQVTAICAALACEGAPNPVAMVCIPTARTVALQSTGKLASMGKIGTISSVLAKSIPGMGTMKIAIAPGIMGISYGTAAAVAGGTVGTIAIAGGFDSSSSHRSPTSP